MTLPMPPSTLLRLVRRMVDLSPREKAAIASLKRVAKTWPKSLWLYSASGELWVMKNNEDNERGMLPEGGFDIEYGVAKISIENDGGDW